MARKKVVFTVAVPLPSGTYIRQGAQLESVSNVVLQQAGSS